MLNAVWWYATHKYRLVDKDLEPHIVSSIQRRTIVGPIVCFIGIGFSYLHARVSLVLYLLLIPFFMRPSHLDIHLRGESHSQHLQITEIVTKIAGDPTQANRAWIPLTEADEGGWGIAGTAYGKEEFADLAAKAAAARAK